MKFLFADIKQVGISHLWTENRYDWCMSLAQGHADGWCLEDGPGRVLWVALGNGYWVFKGGWEEVIIGMKTGMNIVLCSYTSIGMGRDRGWAEEIAFAGAAVEGQRDFGNGTALTSLCLLPSVISFLSIVVNVFRLRPYR